MDAHLICLSIRCHALRVLKLVQKTCCVVQSIIGALKRKYLINWISPVLVTVRLEHIHGELNLPIHVAVFPFLRTGHREQTKLARSWLVSHSVCFGVWPVAWFQSDAPEHSLLRLEESTLNVMPHLSLVIFVEKLFGIH